MTLEWRPTDIDDITSASARRHYDAIVSAVLDYPNTEHEIIRNMQGLHWVSCWLLYFTLL